MRGAIILMQSAGPEVCWLDGLPSKMRFSDPRSLNVR